MISKSPEIILSFLKMKCQISLRMFSQYERYWLPQTVAHSMIGKVWLL